MQALRTLLRNPRFTLAAALTLALGIGANTAIFSFINGVYLRPLPYPDFERLVTVGRAPAASFADWRRDGSFTATGAWAWDVVTISGGPWPERVQTQRIAGDYLSMLGVTPAMGRTFLPQDDVGCALMVSARLWRTGLEGRQVKVDGAACDVVGVMPEGFVPPMPAGPRVDAWMPLRLSGNVSILARLAPGVGIDAARRYEAKAAFLKDRISGPPNRALLSLAGAVGFLLLIACINVATLVSARAAAQRREFAIRSALGATRAQLARLLLGQTTLLAAFGGALGLVFAYASLDALKSLAQYALPRIDEVRVDWRVFAFTAGLSLVSGLLFGLAPAIGVSRVNLRERRTLRTAQVAAQIAIAFVLLTGAGLLIRSFRSIRAVDLGFRTDRVLSANFALPPSRYATPQLYTQFVGEVLTQVRAVPGVVSATATLGVPMRGSAGGKFEIFGRLLLEREEPEAQFRPGDSEYFATFGMTIERGRGFTARDVDGAPAVALVNQRLARTHFGGEDPIGRRIRMLAKDGAMPWMTVVGVVRDTRHTGPLREAMLEVYTPYAQFRSTGLQPRALVVRAAGDAERLVPALQRAVASVDKDQPLVAVGTLEQSLAEFIAPQRFDTTLMAIFAAIGLTLAAVGIFGVMSFRVTQRTQEIGVRMAIGAERGHVLRMVLGDGLKAAGLGLAVGWAGAWWLTRYLKTLLFGVAAHDGATFAAVSAAVVGVAILASWLPAWRASRLDPLTALRRE